MAALVTTGRTRPSGHNRILDANQYFLDAEQALHAAKGAGFSRGQWMQFLDLSRKPEFLRALKNDERRYEWAALVSEVLQDLNYSLRDLLEQRVAEHPKRVLFMDMSQSPPAEWTYEQIWHHIREIAAVFYRISGGSPRVALYTENCLEGACADLACLSFDIYDTPLSTHFNSDILLHIFDTLKINIAVADSRDRLMLLKQLQQRTALPFQILALMPRSQDTREIPYLPEECKKLSVKETEQLLSARRIRQSSEVATTMFTSGSTGLPKGVSFSSYNIIVKRFARAAALPDVGEETFLCYLPLFHTFGRYLEMTGSIFWSGTYVFAGNNSAETLQALFPKICPTGFISIPLRWLELYEKCQEKIATIESEELRREAIHEIVGPRLRWGLSAAGFLDPKVFRFFNQYGIALSSGFGMTEATGGITMTPPGKYRDFTVGVPLPGVWTRLTPQGELELSGHYIGRYLEDAGPGDMIPYPGKGKEFWLPTGDVFKIGKDGFYQIVDRVKDIYKNNRGQTVAPQVIEKKFFNVPGIKSTFLVGDSRPYNVLLIVPDKSDPICKSIRGEALKEYYHQIVTAANTDVAPYERVINFAVLDREFNAGKGELTAKGSFNRKAIETNFKEVIESLYISNNVIIHAQSLRIMIPRWFFRDLGILETDIRYADHQLFNRRNNRSLVFHKLDDGMIRIGDLKYKVSSQTIDLGVFARQPRLWSGNPSLIAFSPVKEGWDASFPAVSPRVYIIPGYRILLEEFPNLKALRDPVLAKTNNLLFQAVFTPTEKAIDAIHGLGNMFAETDSRMAEMIRLRMEALAFHPEERVRTLAYRLILLKAPEPDQIPFMPLFIESGLSFLNEDSIRELARSNFGKHRLDALKRRLYWYRANMHWPASRKNQRQFEYVLKMLYNFAKAHLEYYVSVRAELSRWILHKKDPYLSRKAEEYFNLLAGDFEKNMDASFRRFPLAKWKSRLVFEYGIPDEEKQRITKIFQATTFLQESIYLAFGEESFDLDEIPDGGIWILRLISQKRFLHYRISINTIGGKHFDLHMVMSEDPLFRPKPDTFYWMAALAGFPFGPSVAPFLGSSRPGMGVLTTQYIGGLTAWDKIREFSEIHRSSGYIKPNAWRKLFIKCFSVIFHAWHHSGFQIVPGAISPVNVVAPEMDFKEGAIIVSLTGWSKYTTALSLIEPMIQNFYCKTAALYPWSKNQLDVTWIFDASLESLGKEQAIPFLQQLREELVKKPFICHDTSDLKESLDKYLKGINKRFYLPLNVFNAIDQFGEWSRLNPGTTPEAKEQTIIELMELYRIQKFGDFVRYYFYRHTFFSDAPLKTRKIFDKLLVRMQSNLSVMPIQLLELSELQSAIILAEEKDIFSRMVFPRLQERQKVDFMKVGESLKEHLVITFDLLDRNGTHYIQRTPIEPREVGQLYQLFFREDYPKEITEDDHQCVVVDKDNRIIGGLTWRYLDQNSVILDGIVVTSSLQGKGLGSAMMENFFTHMAGMGIKVIKAHFLFGNYYMKHYFEVDKKWGALIKTLN